MTGDRHLALVREVRRAVQADARAGKPRACDACGEPIVAREPAYVVVPDDLPIRVEHHHIDGVARCQR